MSVSFGREAVAFRLFLRVTLTFINWHHMKMAMASLNISLPEPLKAYVEHQVSKGDYGTPSEYVRDLIRQDKERRKTRLEAELLDALDSPQVTLDLNSVDEHAFLDLLRSKLKTRAAE